MSYDLAALTRRIEREEADALNADGVGPEHLLLAAWPGRSGLLNRA